MKEIYLTIAGRIRQEIQELEKVVSRTKRIWKKAAAATDDFYVDAIALNLHSFYAGLERLFEIIAERIDQTRPAGPSWHQELLRQIVTGIPDVRPPVLTLETRDRLDRYRGFRHIVRNVYTFNMDSEQI